MVQSYANSLVINQAEALPTEVPFLGGKLMKKNRYSRSINYQLYKQLDEDFNIKDLRYWGIFGHIKNKAHPTSHIRIDPKRFQKTTRTTFSEDMLKAINARKSHYFYPAKYDRSDYNCNIFIDEIEQIRKDWTEIFKPLIDREIARIEKPRKVVAADDYNYMCGITDYDESEIWAMRTNWRNQQKYIDNINKIIYSLYSQFYHQMASRIEAITIFVLAKNGKNVEHFDRNALYDYAGSTGTARDFEHYSQHDKLYCIWHFIKHNSTSTYLRLKERYPEVLYDAEFKQGHIAASYIKFSEELITQILDGCGEFFKEYCSKVYKEDYDQANWNYELYFYDIASDEIENIEDPMGLRYY